jgi:hypothetical protein
VAREAADPDQREQRGMPALRSATRRASENTSSAVRKRRDRAGQPRHRLGCAERADEAAEHGVEERRDARGTARRRGGESTAPVCCISQAMPATRGSSGSWSA